MIETYKFSHNRRVVQLIQGAGKITISLADVEGNWPADEGLDLTYNEFKEVVSSAMKNEEIWWIGRWMRSTKRLVSLEVNAETYKWKHKCYNGFWLVKLREPDSYTIMDFTQPEMDELHLILNKIDQHLAY